MVCLLKIQLELLFDSALHYEDVVAELSCVMSQLVWCGVLSNMRASKIKANCPTISGLLRLFLKLKSSLYKNYHSNKTSHAGRKRTSPTDEESEE